MQYLSNPKLGVLNNECLEGFERTLLQEVKDGNYIEVYKQLKKKPSMINAQDKLGNTLIHWAVRRHHIETLRVLLHFKPDLTIKDI